MWTAWLAALPLAVYLAAPATGKWLRQKMLENQLGDLYRMGVARAEHEKIKGTAVICGGSIGGIIAARICHDHFDEVLVVEAEEWVAGEDGCNPHAWTQTHRRTRVMQYNSLQGLLAFSYLCFTYLFPGFDEECKASDIRVLPANHNFFLRGAPALFPYHLGDKLAKTLFSGRQGLETLLRRLLLRDASYPNVRWVAGAVTGVNPDPEDTSRLGNVMVQTKEGAITIKSALVVDCTGASQAGLKWLQRAGYGPARSDKTDNNLEQLSVSYNPGILYSSCIFKLTPDLCARMPIPGGYENVGIFCGLLADPKLDRRLVSAARLEGDRLMISTGGWAPAAELPRTLQGLKETCRSFILDQPMPEWWFEMLDMLDACEDTMECYPVRLPPCNHVRFHEMSNLPSNFIAIGDSVMRLNPVFGHGIPCAVQGCITLNKLLSELTKSQGAGGLPLPSSFSREFFKTQWGKIQAFWEDAKVFDYGYETTKPCPGESLSLGMWKRVYLRHFMKLTTEDRDVAEVQWRVSMLLAPSIDAVHPRIALKVLWHIIRGGNA
ncbi:hypothetical protein HYDPIDRAFT_81894 [Hydnomerulius pinastri MD-312]|nr:hypothetical protein HYDPIDRAFT_81894 [Hydnomerulius pinastri MD-312]